MPTRVSRSTPYFELRDAQALAGCPVCRLVYRRTARYLDMLLYEAVLDPAVRERLKSTYGFCREHVAMLHARPGRSLGVALIYESILRRVVALGKGARIDVPGLADRLRGRGGTGAAIAAALRPSEPCPACAVRCEAESGTTALLAEALADDELHAAYAAGEGLCLPHLALTLEAVRDEETLQRLLQPQLARYRAMLADLTEYIAKNDHRRMGEPLGPEGDVWLRAMNAMAGGEGLGLSARHGGRRAADLDETPAARHRAPDAATSDAAASDAAASNGVPSDDAPPPPGQTTDETE